MKPQPNPVSTPLCSARKLRRVLKRRHVFEDFMAYRLGLDPKVKDALERARGPNSRLTTILEEDRSSDPTAPVAIYAHYNRSRRITSMVQRQLELIRDQGFQIHFVSMSEIAHSDDLDRLRNVAAAAYVRRSFGRDFGAWCDLWQINADKFSKSREVLLLNDSILGPIFPLDPIFAQMRAGKEGLYGLTDSPDRVPHLQSYFLLFRGAGSIAALDDFFSRIKLSFRKSTMIRRGELALSGHMMRAGTHIFSLYSYDALEAYVTSDMEHARPAMIACPALVPGVFGRLAFDSSAAAVSRELSQMRNSLQEKALNPTHYFWRTLVEVFGFPFVKTELIKVNPAGLANLDAIEGLVPDDGPVSLQEIRDHLESA